MATSVKILSLLLAVSSLVRTGSCFEEEADLIMSSSCRHNDHDCIIKGLRSDIGKLNRRIRRLQGGLEETNNRVSVTEADTKAAADLIQEVESRINSLEDNNENLLKTVAFTARMNTDGDFNPQSTEDPLPFTDVFTNVGESYSGDTYKFTCNVTGLYFFSFSMYSGKLEDKASHSYLYHSGTSGDGRVAWAESETHNPDSIAEAQASNSAVIHCKAGEEVYMRSTSTKTTNKFWSRLPAFPTCTFSGFLIRADLPE